MKQFLELVKREYKNNRKIDNNPSTFSKIIKVFFKVLFLSLIVLFESLLFRMVIKVCVSNMLTNEFLVLFLSIFFIVQLIMNIFSIIKVLHRTNENKEILSLPIKQETVLYSKLFILFVKDIFFSLLVVAPVLINFSIITGQSHQFIYLILPCILIMNILSLLLSVILSIPTLYFVDLISNNFVIVSILYFTLIFVGFSLYILILRNLLNFFESSDFAGLIPIERIHIIQDMCLYFPIGILLKNILLNSKILGSLIILLVSIIFLSLIVHIIAKKLYFKILRNSLIKEPKFSKKITKFKKMSKTHALLNKEAKTIFRSQNYSFAFYVISFSTPILVFCSNILIAEIGLKIAGSLIYPGLAILILSLFMTMAGSFSATSITREGKEFSATKTYPVSYQKQIKAKLFLYMLVEIPALFISLLSLFLARYITIIDFVMIFFIVLFLTYSSIISGIYLDLKKPQFNYLSDNEIVQNNQNISKNLYLGIAISILISIISIVLLFIIPKIWLYVIVLVISLTYAIIRHCVLFKNIDKKYQLIEY